MERKLKILGGIGFGSIGYYLGSEIGKSLYDFIANLPAMHADKYPWFDYNQYIQTYQQYSSGLRDLFSIIFGLVVGGLSLVYYVGLLSLAKKGGDKSGNI